MIYDFQARKTKKLKYLMQNLDHWTKYSGNAAVWTVLDMFEFFSKQKKNKPFDIEGSCGSKNGEKLTEFVFLT